MQSNRTETTVITTNNKLAYSVKEAAAQAALSVPYIRNEIRDGNLKAKKAGRRVLILSQDLQDYLSKLSGK